MNNKLLVAGVVGAIVVIAVVGVGLYLRPGPLATVGPECRVLHGHRARVAALAFSPDGQTLVSSGGTLGKAGEVHVWEVASGAERVLLPTQADSVEAVAYSPDGKSLATAANDGTVTLWDGATGKQQQVFHTRAVVCSLAFADQGRTLLVAGFSEVIHAWDLHTGRQRISRHGGFGPKALSPDGRALAAATGRDGSLILYDLVTGKQHRCSPPGKHLVTAVAFSPGGKAVASVDYAGCVTVWDGATGRRRWTLEGRAAEVTAVAFSPSGDVLATGSRDRTVKLWEAATGREKAVLEGHAASVRCVTFGPDGKVVASGSFDRTVRVWEVG
jgi:WD40 repeat protein